MSSVKYDDVTKEIRKLGGYAHQAILETHKEGRYILHVIQSYGFKGPFEKHIFISLNRDDVLKNGADQVTSKPPQKQCQHRCEIHD